MPHVEEHRFGPGSLEDLVLKTWVSKRENYDLYRVTGRLEGNYRIYCGEGNEHDFEVKEDIGYWNSEIVYGDGLESDSFLLFEVHNLSASLDAKWALAERILSYALTDWDDPCEVTEL